MVLGFLVLGLLGKDLALVLLPRSRLTKKHIHTLARAHCNRAAHGGGCPQRGPPGKAASPAPRTRDAPLPRMRWGRGTSCSWCVADHSGRELAAAARPRGCPHTLGPVPAAVYHVGCYRRVPGHPSHRAPLGAGVAAAHGGGGSEVASRPPARFQMSPLAPGSQLWPQVYSTAHQHKQVSPPLRKGAGPAR